MLRHLGEARLVRCDAHLAVVGLRVDEVGEKLVEFHGGEVTCEDVQVALEREAYAKCVLVREYLRKDIIKKLIAR